MNLGVRSPPPLRLLLLVVGVFAVSLGRSDAGTTRDFEGTPFASLTVGKKTYVNVQVREVTARTLTIVHSGGMASIPLRELSPELQAHFRYDPAADLAAEAKLSQARAATEERLAREKHAHELQQSDVQAAKFERLVQNFGTAPELQASVDLRPKFLELSLGVKDQGYRPSCSVFAVVSALEYQNAMLCGKTEKLSEEYLIWATRRTTHRIAGNRSTEIRSAPETEATPEKDEGFALAEVVAALRAYGVPLQLSMPNTFGTKIDAIPEPSPEIMNQARSRRRVFVHMVPGHDGTTRINNLIHALNEGVPVPIGIRWPHYRTLRGGYLSEQKPILDYAHAVTIVGYRCDTGRLEDTVFLFKNSYGTSWGEGGYGRVTFSYLRQYMLDAVLLEVQRGES